MRNNKIIQVAKIIEEWNPLGEKANSIKDLEGYRYEAMDIISSYKILSKQQSLKESIEKVLTQAFHIELNESKLTEATQRIKTILNIENEINE